jgi:NAD-dependent SIR2 family protein deacetylase
MRDPREVQNMPEVYCVKCKAKREAIEMKNGKPALSGVCQKCGTKVFKIGG